MAKKRYSRQELYVLRNHIPIDRLIKDLGIPFKTNESCFRFCCPYCRGYDTAVKSATNLARCFHCEKNYNTIDLVMLVKKSDFTNSVNFLKTVYKQTKNPSPALILPNKRGASQPKAIGDILKTIKPASKLPIKNSNTLLTVEMLNDRVQRLERQVTCLSQKIEEINKNR
jgi:hypothetical protein